jgi:8-oxo-dGTP diphosphatase
MLLLETINPEHVSEEEVATFPVREAARAVVADAQGNIALLHVPKNQYYKLPGGGIEHLEDQKTALFRECKEEIGCEVEVVSEIGMIVEYRKFCTLKQISYCYFAKVIGEKGELNLMPDEIAEGFELLWVPYDAALALFAKNEALDIEATSYIFPRDAIFLKAASHLIKKGN